jgi:hypothetical protein
LPLALLSCARHCSETERMAHLVESRVIRAAPLAALTVQSICRATDECRLSRLSISCRSLRWLVCRVAEIHQACSGLIRRRGFDSNVGGNCFAHRDGAGTVILLKVEKCTESNVGQYQQIQKSRDGGPPNSPAYESDAQFSYERRGIARCDTGALLLQRSRGRAYTFPATMITRTTGR